MDDTAGESSFVNELSLGSTDIASTVTGAVPTGSTNTNPTSTVPPTDLVSHTSPNDGDAAMRLPDGNLIDAKNTLQSHSILALAAEALAADAVEFHTERNSRNRTNGMHPNATDARPAVGPTDPLRRDCTGPDTGDAILSAMEFAEAADGSTIVFSSSSMDPECSMWDHADLERGRERMCRNTGSRTGKPGKGGVVHDPSHDADSSDFFKQVQGVHRDLSPFDKEELLDFEADTLNPDLEKGNVSRAIAPESSIDTGNQETNGTVPQAHAMEWHNFAEARIVPHENDACLPLPVQRVQAETPVSTRLAPDEPHLSTDQSREEPSIVQNENPTLPPADPVLKSTNDGVNEQTGIYCRLAALGLVLLLLVALLLFLQLWHWRNTNGSPMAKTDVDNRTDAISSAPKYLTDQVIAYIQNVTLSGQQFLQVTSFEDNTTLEERALKILLEKGLFQEYPDTPYHQFRWRQRYALATMWIHVGNGMDIERIEHECDWSGVDCEKIYLDGINESVKAVTEIFIGHQYSYSFPADAGMLTSMQHVDLSSNWFGGSLPLSLQYWTNLKSFKASDSGFYGSFPECMRYWTLLERFDMSDNFVTGTLPTYIGGFTNLKEFRIGSNRLMGRLPQSVAQWTNLEQLQVSNNNLWGTFPEGSWQHLSRFEAESNSFYGSFPNSCSHWYNLTVVDVSSNRLGMLESQDTSELPECIQNWTSIQTLDMSANAFNGSLPAGIGQWTHIRSLNVSRNGLTGSLPASMAGLTTMESFDVSNNTLTGTFAESLANWTHIQFVDVSGNNFNGNLGSLCNASHLFSLRIDCSTKEMCPCCAPCY